MPCQVQFTIPLKAVSWNVLVRQHYWKVKGVFDTWKDATGYAVLAARIKPIPASAFPVEVQFRASWKYRRRHDIDSLIVKPILDTITAMGIWPDDSHEYVARVSFEGRTGCDNDKLEVLIRSI